MKKSHFLFLCLFLLLCLSSLSSAQSLVGSRASGMGGAGVAIAYDLTSAYYNPACLLKAGGFGLQGSAASSTNLSDVASALGSISDPGKFASDNYSKKVDLTGSLGGLLGINMSKVGLTVIPSATVAITKAANSLEVSGDGTGNYSGVLTIGNTFSMMAGLPDISVGANLKYLGGVAGNIAVTASGTGAAGTQSVSSRTGFGADVGALMTFSIPAVTDLSVGLVVRDLGESISTTTTTNALTTTGSGQAFTKGPDVKTGPVTTTTDSTYAIGVAGTIPGLGILVAADIENGKNFSNTHMGIEYPVIAGFLALRAGVASGNNLSLSTFGAKISIPFFAINAAMVTDNKISSNNSYTIDFGAAL